MKNEYAQDLATIRNIMEQRTKFLSLSGLSGIMAGVYALIGAFVASRIIVNESATMRYNENGFELDIIAIKLLTVALMVLVAALVSGLAFSYKKTKSEGKAFWNQAAKMLIWSLLVPLLAGGVFILVLIYRNEIALIGPASLIFYGLALFSGGNYTYSDIKHLGIAEIIVGCLALFYPGYGLYFWAFGFGVLHILYGAIMFFKYER